VMLIACATLPKVCRALVNSLLPYRSAVVCQALLSCRTCKIYVRKCVGRILDGELSEGYWLMRDAAGQLIQWWSGADQAVL